MNKKLNGVNLSAMFNIDLAPSDTATDDAVADAAMCPKCHGRGNFISHSGRIVGRCFTCGGTGLTKSAGVVLAADDCVKCAGTGEWNPGRPCFACNGTGKLVATTTIDVSAIAIAFAAAHSNGIKRPKLRLDTFQFSRAPDHGNNAGSIYVKDTESGVYLGKVTAGQFHKSRECDDPTIRQAAPRRTVRRPGPVRAAVVS